MTKIKKWLLLFAATVLVVCIGLVGSALTYKVYADTSDVMDEQGLLADMADGDVILKNDVTIESTIEVNKDTSIDLNGHILKFEGTGNAEEKSVIKVAQNASLTVLDSDKESLHNYTLNTATGLYAFSDGAETISGGIICGGQGTTKDGATYGGGIYVEEGATLKLLSGTIAGNSAEYGGGIYCDGTLNILGGNVLGNVATKVGGGIYATSTFTVQGDIKVANNYVLVLSDKTDGNIYIDKDIKLVVTGEIGDDSDIRFTVGESYFQPAYAPSFLENFAGDGTGSYDNTEKDISKILSADNVAEEGKVLIAVLDRLTGCVTWQNAVVVSGVSFKNVVTEFTGEAQATAILPTSKLSDLTIASINNGNSDLQLRNAGTYSVTLSLVSTDGVIRAWEDGTTGAKTFTVEIDPKEVAEPTQGTAQMTYTGKEITFEYTDSADSSWYTIKEGTAESGLNTGKYTLTFELREPENTVWKTAGTSSDISFTFEIDDIAETSLFWLVLVLAAVLIVELLAFSIYWQERRRQEDPDMYDQTNSNGGTMTDGFLPLTPALLVAAPPTWELILVIVLAAAIVGVALYNVIKIALENARLAHQHAHGEDIDRTNLFHSSYGAHTGGTSTTMPPELGSYMGSTDDDKREEVTKEMMTNDDRPPEEILAEKMSGNADEYDVGEQSPWRVAEPSFDPSVNSIELNEDVEEPSSYAWDDNEEGEYSQHAVFTIGDEDGDEQLTIDQIPIEAKEAEHVIVTDSNGEVEEMLKSVDEENNIAYVVKYKKSFTARLIQSSEESKEYYSILKNEALSYKGTKSRISWDYDCISVDMRPVIKMDIRGKTLCLYFALEPESLDSNRYAVERTQLKKCDNVPCLYRIRDDKCLSLAKELVAKVCQKFNLERGRTRTDIYSYPYEDIQSLVERELAKEYVTKEKYDQFLKKAQKADEDRQAETKQEAQNNVEPETKLDANTDAESTEKAETVEAESVEKEEKPAPKKRAQAESEERSYFNDDDIEEECVTDEFGRDVVIQYNKSFTAKLIQSSDETKSFYSDLKNEIMSYKKTKSTVWWSCDSIRTGNRTIARFGMCDHTLCLYMALNPANCDEKYQVEVAEGKRYEHVPCLYRIKNAKREKYAKDLIAKLCKKYGLEWDGNRNDNYYLPYESTDELLAKELVKEVGEKKNDVPKTKEECKKEVESSQRSMISAGEADRLISNQAALCCLADDTGGKPFKGNAEEINIDKIAAYFNAGEVVNLASLKKKGLVPHNTKAIKICARGTLSKPLKVEAQDYSLVAVKMILISGGKAKKVK